MDIKNYNIALYDRFSNENANPHIQSSDKAKILYQSYLQSKANPTSPIPVDVSKMDLKKTIILNNPFSFGGTVSADSAEINHKGLKIYDASHLPAAPTDDPEFTAWCGQQYGPNLTPVIVMPTTFGDFGGNRGDLSKVQPVNFNQLGADGLHSGATLDDYVKAGVIDPDYVTQFDAILKNSKGDLNSGDHVLINALNKYAELRDGILNSGSLDPDSKVKQLENSLNWSVGTSLNRFGFDMTQSNAMLVKSPAYSDANRNYRFMYGDGSIAQADIFSYNNSSYKTATNIVFSAAKLMEKGIRYINANPYDPSNAADASSLLSAINSGTNDNDSSNLSLSTLSNVVSTFRSFELATNDYILSNAGKAAQDAPAEDIASVYTHMRYLIEHDRLEAHVDEQF